MTSRIGRPPTCTCGACKKCQNARRNREWWSRKSAEERREIVAKRDPQKTRAADTARYQRDPEKRHAVTRRYQDPHKQAARVAVANAIRSGRLERGTCEREGADCRGMVQGHHDDYGRPLIVRWLCIEHHQQVHREMRALTSGQKRDSEGGSR